MEKVKIFASIVDDTTKKQIEDLSSSEAYKACTIRVMPDCHAGKSCTIGSVIQFTNKVIPNTVGVDIGCGMLVVTLGKIDINFQLLDVAINAYIPSGFNVHDTPVRDFGLDLLFASIEKKEYIKRSIGTLGGGNHFIEIDVDKDDNKYLVIHSGSRNLGVQVCEYWQKKAIANLTDLSDARNAIIEQYTKEGRQKEISEALKSLKKPVINKELAYLEGEDLYKYINDMGVCQHYASVNRHTMAEIIMEKMGWTAIDTFTTVHNYIDILPKIIRKGAISARENEKVIIPMNMRDGSLICRGKGNEDWLCSAPHGAGRIMSRNQAFENLNIEDFKKSMEGIYTSSVCPNTIDESPMVYKPADTIIKDIQDTVEVINVIKPVYNFKAK